MEEHDLISSFRGTADNKRLGEALNFEPCQASVLCVCLLPAKKIISRSVSDSHAQKG